MIMDKYNDNRILVAAVVRETYHALTMTHDTDWRH